MFDAVVKSIDEDLNVTIEGQKTPLTEFASYLEQKGIDTVIASHSFLACVECSSGPDTFAVTYVDGDAMILCRNCAYCGIFRSYNLVADWKMRRNLMMQEEE